jgi:hypothetical protein
MIGDIGLPGGIAMRNLNWRTLRASARVAAVVAMLGGCVAPYEFTSPCAPDSNSTPPGCYNGPGTQASIHFDSNFDPSNPPTVQLNGVDISKTLWPPPAPNGTSVIPLPPPDQSVLPPDNPYTYWNSQNQLTADSPCGFFCVYPTKSMWFNVPILVLWPSAPSDIGSVGSLLPGQWAEVIVGTQSVLATPIQVTITTSDTPPDRIGLSATSNGPLSQSIVVTLPANAGGQQMGTPFFVMAFVKTGPFYITAEATGVVSAYTFGQIVLCNAQGCN